LHETGRDSVIREVYDKCKLQENLPKEQIYNYVKEIYAPFTDEEISDKIAEMLTPPGTSADVKIVYQSLEGMHKAIPNHKGDWYFSGDYPTPGGNRLVNKAFINYYEGNANKRD
jgi:amidophosphoribosyltransferase